MAGEQTEKATPRRREKARAHGQFVRSRELASSAVLLTGAVLLPAAGESLAGRWRGLLDVCLQLGNGDLSASGSRSLAAAVRTPLLAAIALPAGLLAACFGVALFVNVAQSRGLTLRTEGSFLQWQRLSPLANAKQLFSITAAGRAAKQLVPTLVIGVLAARIIRIHFAAPPLAAPRIEDALRAAQALMVQAAAVMLGWSALDYMLEWRAHEQRLRMSKQEMREEMKEQEGSPQIKRRIRQVQRAMRRSRIKADVARASVVVTNPTHYAVALEFSMETMAAPKVLTKGRNLFAQQIKDEARWAGVPVTENPPLARSLYKHVEPGQSIPAELFGAVAEILAFLYRAEIERRQRAAHQEHKR